MEKFTIKANEVGERLDKILALRFNDHSRVAWKNQIQSGHVLVNDNPTEPRYIVQQNDNIKYDIPNNTCNLQPTTYDTLPLEIIFENADVLVINKPTNLITHPAHANVGDSVVHRILAYDHNINKAVYDADSKISKLRPGIVHRLDKDTSGVMIIAKNKVAMTHLAKQIQNHQAQKTYIALLFGHLEQDDILVDTWLNRDTSDRRKMAVTIPEEGREAKTIFHIKDLLVNSKGDKITWVEATPITGRTHQIRVHAAHLGHPVLGDQNYFTHESQLLSNRLGIKRQLLHASTLKIRLPKETNLSSFSSDAPQDFINALKGFSRS